MEIYENLDLNDLNGEEWKYIEEFEDYQISKFGRVKRIIPDRRNRRLKILKQNRNKFGYFCVILCKNEKIKHKFIHRLVYETFNNSKLKLNECVHHKDRYKDNNNFENLIMMTKKEHNSLHKKEENKGKNNGMFGIRRFGENNPNCKITNQKRISIMDDIEKENITQAEIAKKYGVHHETISRIKNKKGRWIGENNE